MDLFRTNPEKIAAMLDHLRRTAEDLGLPFTTRTKTYNSRLAQELGLWAVDRGKGDTFHTAAFRAYFADGLNLAEHRVLLDLAHAAGLPPQETELVLLERTYAQRVEKDWDDARIAGITAVPTLLMDEHKLVGAQTYENLAAFVSLCGAVRRDG